MFARCPARTRCAGARSANQMFVQLLIAGVICGAVGLLIGWLFGRGHAKAPSDNPLAAELRRQLDQRGSELAGQREQLAGIREQNAGLDAKAKFLEEKLQTEKQQIESLQQKFQKEFEAISNKLLIDNSNHFNRQSNENLEKLLLPFKDNLNEFKSKLDVAHREASSHNALLKDQISRIGTEAANLSKALKGDVKVLGNWGENMLDQILEKSGLQIGVHYRRQQGAKDGEGDQRFLDVIVELPDKKNLIIDSKVSLKNYEEHINAVDDTSRKQQLGHHIESIRNHFRGLGSKRYQDIHGINTPDFVLMYIPIEAAFFVALAQAPGLFAEALDKNVVLITNSTLLATLRTVASVWKLADQQKNAIDIADRGGKLYDKFVGFINDLEDIRKSLQAGQRAWDAAAAKLHSGSGNLVRQAEQLKELGVKASKVIPSDIAEKARENDHPPEASLT